MQRNKLLAVNDLSIAFGDKRNPHVIYEHAALDIFENDIIGLWGPSGSGKSVLARTIFNADLGRNSQCSGTINYVDAKGKSTQLFPAKTGKNHRIYGAEVSMVFQEPGLAFNPVFKVGKQIVETLRKHRGLGTSQAIDLVEKEMTSVGLSDAKLLQKYPHELSGGQLQRLMILLAIINQPRLLVADEPTTSLDSIHQKQILDLLLELKARGTALLIITHDIDVLNYLDAKVYQVENRRLTESPAERTALGILAKPELTEQPPALEVANLRVGYGKVPVIHDLQFQLRSNEILGLVGPSGCGKSTIARTICKILSYEGQILPEYPRGKVQMIFQHPGSALDPSQSIGGAVSEALLVSGIKGRSEQRKKALELFEQVGLPEKFYDHYPHQLSGGMKQRGCIARALATSPEVLICDEAVSSLDAGLKWRMAELLVSLATEKGMSLLFISHDIELVSTLCHRVIVMENGAIAEEFTPSQDVMSPGSEILKKLLDARLRKGH